MVSKPREPQTVPENFNPIAWLKYGRAVTININFSQGAFQMLPVPGTYQAKTVETTVYQKDTGVVIMAAVFETAPDTTITGYFTLVLKDGSISAKTVENLRNVYGWDGQDFFWLDETDLSGVPVQIVVNEEPDLKGVLRPNVKWLNRPGEHGATPAKMEKATKDSLRAKFGAQLRAIAGTMTTKPAPKPAPPKPSMPPAVQSAEVNYAPKGAPVAPCTMPEAWAAFCDASGGKWTQPGLSQEWFAAVAALCGKEQTQVTPEGWGAFVAAVKAGYFNDKVAV